MNFSCAKSYVKNYNYSFCMYTTTMNWVWLNILITLMSESTIECFIWVRPETGIFKHHAQIYLFGYTKISSMLELGLIYLLLTPGTNPKNGKDDRWCCKEEERTGTWAYSYHDSSGTGS